MEQNYPVIVKRAKKEKAKIHWADGTSISNQANYGRSFAPEGKTPVIPRPAKRLTQSMISSETNQGKLRFMIYDGALNTAIFLRFLRRLIKDADRKLFVIVDDLRVQRADVVMPSVAEHADRITLFYLPPCAPERNPDEYVNNDVKQALGRRSTPTDKVTMEADLKSHMRGLQRGPDKVRSLLVDRGLEPKVCRLFLVDGAKALRKAIRQTFGMHTPIQRCQVHKGRNIMERLPKHLHASVRRPLHQAWEMDDLATAEQLIRNLARRLEQEAPGVSATILEGMDDILTVVRLKLPLQLRRSLACTNIIENVKHWRNAAIALRWTGAAMQEAAKGFRRLKVHKQLPVLQAALREIQTQQSVHSAVAPEAVAA